MINVESAWVNGTDYQIRVQFTEQGFDAFYAYSDYFTITN